MPKHPLGTLGIPGFGTAWIATLVLWQVLRKVHMILRHFPEQLPGPQRTGHTLGVPLFCVS